MLSWFSLIIVPPRGAWASEVPAPSPRHPRAAPFKFDVLPAEELFFIFAASEALKRHFCPPLLPTVFRTRWGPFWDQFWLQTFYVVDLCLVPSVLFFEVNFHSMLAMRVL